MTGLGFGFKTTLGLTRLLGALTWVEKEGQDGKERQERQDLNWSAWVVGRTQADAIFFIFESVCDLFLYSNQKNESHF